MNRKLKMGMIGGGQGAFIGGVHRIAAQLDGLIELHCGAFSSNPENSKITAKSLFLEDHKAYDTFEEMIIQESQLPEGEKMDFVSIVTPNFAHFKPALMALEYGFHVVIDKPITLTLEEAKQLHKKVKETGLLLCLTHTYAGYPMVEQAKHLIEQGKLGQIRKIIVEYPQGWLSSAINNKQANWRTDSSKSGISGCMGDIGTHAAHLAEYISGLEITKICADINIVVPNRELDDDGNVLLKFNNGANGVLIASQIAAGEENALSIRVYGELGGLEWHQMEPNSLILKWSDAPSQVYRTGMPYNCEKSKLNSRTPAGHPEGYIEAFANIYRNFSVSLNNYLDYPNNERVNNFPSIEEGLRGMAFIENVIASGKSSEKWYNFKI
ncbi:Gfo/Idh/MocA family protein [Pedobacter flavus]|uniref:Gfo/Idh/MocA family oxidoreductase n=1 Tax=Pedobacter flavus TaxID=3113906 RepID=A0ABU7H0V1_9SPHI|nr:Gfo/Idh/MocA family oxidoreductase [Pedobacter sp. VNH31]MEE1884865.1 Gfo/Idh/MocA family oxidoreductase [Pedobacter sp. VNH31]